MRALICGVGGQDGSYLARLLLGKGYEVWGTTRDVNGALGNLDALGIRPALNLRALALDDARDTGKLLAEARPDEVYCLASQSSVARSFAAPAETFAANTLGVLGVLEAIRAGQARPRLFHASSGECFGPLGGVAASEATRFAPVSPYGIAKAAAHALVASYREGHGLYAVNGILFSHESPLRPERFVTRKITSAAARIARHSGERLALGRLDVVRDWGWAPDYVEAMWRTLQQPAPSDFVIATGEGRSLEAFVAAAFAAAGLDWQDYVDTDPALVRPTDLDFSVGDPRRAADVLGWRATFKMADVARAMLAAEFQ